MSRITRLEVDLDKEELVINGKKVDFRLEVDIYDGHYPTRKFFNKREAKTGDYFPVLLIEASNVRELIEAMCADETQTQ